MKITLSQLQKLNYYRVTYDKHWCEVARGIGMTPSNFSHLIRGRIHFTMERAFMLAEYFNCDLKEFYE